MTPSEYELVNRKVKLGPGVAKLNAPRSPDVHTDRKPPCPVVEPVVRDALPSPRARAPQGSHRYVVRIKSFRSRLCDPDNLCGKFFVDCLRYSGILPDDTAAIMDYSISQQKTKKGEEERTVIEIVQLPELDGVEAAAHFSETLAAVNAEEKL